MVYFKLVKTASCLFIAYDSFSLWIIIHFILLRTFKREIFWKRTKLQQLEADVFVFFLQFGISVLVSSVTKFLTKYLKSNIYKIK